jgi:integrase
MDKTGRKKSIKMNKSALAILVKFKKPGAEPHHYIFPILSNTEPYCKFVTYHEKRTMPWEIRTKLHNHISANTSQINNNLADIFTLLELEKKISFNTGRHSFADKARRAMKTSNKITLLDIKNSLGHKKIDTTEKYINSLDYDSMDEAMDSIFD